MEIGLCDVGNLFYLCTCIRLEAEVGRPCIGSSNMVGFVKVNADVNSDNLITVTRRDNKQREMTNSGLEMEK